MGSYSTELCPQRQRDIPLLDVKRSLGRCDHREDFRAPSHPRRQLLPVVLCSPIKRRRNTSSPRWLNPCLQHPG
jgi:hypothetical protein